MVVCFSWSQLEHYVTVMYFYHCTYIGQTGCMQGDLRLVGGTNQYEGRVEFCNNNQWGTVCDDQFGRTDSVVVCRQLGFGYSGITFCCPLS